MDLIKFKDSYKHGKYNVKAIVQKAGKILLSKKKEHKRRNLKESKKHKRKKMKLHNTEN